MDCFLCLQSKTYANEHIQINSSEWDDQNIQSIIEKHLWPLNAYKTESQWLCLSCWQIINEFHEFYTRIESAHINVSSLMKCESDTSKSKDFLPVNLFEPEVVLDQKVALVKQEYKESEIDEISVKDYKDEDDIPLISLRPCVDSLLRDPINDSGHSIEDPLIKKQKTKRIKKIKAKSDSIKTTKNIVHKNRIECNVKSEPNISQTPNETSVSSLLITANNSNYPLRYYYQPKMEISEYDSFITQHFRLVCNKCQSLVETFEELQRHFKDAHKTKHGYVICCGTKFRDRAYLVDHINLHMNPEYFKCQHCPQVLTLRKSYNNHMKNHQKVYGCEMCDMQFVSKYLVNKHKLTHLPGDEKKFPCDTCEKCFPSENVLNVHQRVVHLRIYSKLCEICGQNIPNSESFKRHMEKHEGITEPTISCGICGRFMSSKVTLRNHMKFIHPADGKRDYICPICLKVSPNKRALKLHVRVVHTSGTNHKCTICEKAFKRRDHLKDHMATHTGVGTSKCPWCPKVFNANSSMHLHRKKVHPKEWEEVRLKRYSGKITSNAKPQPVSDTDNIPLQFEF